MSDGKNSLQGLGSRLSVSGLINLYQIENNRETSDKVNGKFIFEQYQTGDIAAVKAVNSWCEEMVSFFLLITYFYNPEVICIGGAVSQQEWFIQKLQELFRQRKHAMKDIVTTKITSCKYQGDANLLGGVLAARNHFEEKREQKLWIS